MPSLRKTAGETGHYPGAFGPRTNYTVLYQYQQTVIPEIREKELKCTPRELAAWVSARHESWPLGVRGPGTQPPLRWEWVSCMRQYTDTQTQLTPLVLKLKVLVLYRRFYFWISCIKNLINIFATITTISTFFRIISNLKNHILPYICVHRFT